MSTLALNMWTFRNILIFLCFTVASSYELDIEITGLRRLDGASSSAFPIESGGFDLNNDNDVPILRSMIQNCDGKIDMLFDLFVNFVSKDGKTPLHYAVAKGNEKMAEYLLDRGAQVNARDDDEQTPLMFISTGNKNLVDLLVKRGADTKLTDKEVHTILDHAIESGDDTLIDVLIENGVEFVGEKSFFVAVSKDKGKIAKKLIKDGVNVNATNEQLQTALHVAALHDISHLSTYFHSNSVQRYQFYFQDSYTLKCTNFIENLLEFWSMNDDKRFSHIL